MHHRKAKTSNLAWNNFSVWLRCDVLAHLRQIAAAAAARLVAVRRAVRWLYNFYLSAEAPATRKKYRDWRREQRALGCRLPIRHVATRRLCRLFYLSLTSALISAKELYEGASSLKLLFCKVYLFNKRQEYPYVTHVLLSFYFILHLLCLIGYSAKMFTTL